MNLLDALREIERNDPDAYLSKLMLWKVSDLIAAIQSGDSGYGFDWKFPSISYDPRLIYGMGWMVTSPSIEGGEDIVFSTPTPKVFGIAGGSARTEQKRRAAAENGRKGGRPHYFAQLYSQMDTAIKHVVTQFPVEHQPTESPVAFCLRCAEIMWLVRWQPIDRSVEIFQNSNRIRGYNTVNNSPETLAKMLVEEIHRQKLMNTPAK